MSSSRVTFLFPSFVVGAARATTRRACFSMRAAHRARLGLEGRRSARFLARSDRATSRPVWLIAPSCRALAPSVRRRLRQTRNRETSGQTSHTSAPAPARRNAPWVPCSTPYQAPATTRGRVGERQASGKGATWRRKFVGAHRLYPEREVKKALRRTLFKYKLHQDVEVFGRAYGYIREYYRTGFKVRQGLAEKTGEHVRFSSLPE